MARRGGSRRRSRLHKVAHYARRALGDDEGVVLRNETVALMPDRDVEVDVAVFRERARVMSTEKWPRNAGTAELNEARAHLAVAEGDPVRAAVLLDEAMAGFETAGQPVDAARCRRTREDLAIEPVPG